MRPFINNIVALTVQAASETKAAAYKSGALRIDMEAEKAMLAPSGLKELVDIGLAQLPVAGDVLVVVAWLPFPSPYSGYRQCWHP